MTANIWVRILDFSRTTSCCKGPLCWMGESWILLLGLRRGLRVMLISLFFGQIKGFSSSAGFSFRKLGQIVRPTVTSDAWVCSLFFSFLDPGRRGKSSLRQSGHGRPLLPDGGRVCTGPHPFVRPRQGLGLRQAELQAGTSREYFEFGFPHSRFFRPASTLFSAVRTGRVSYPARPIVRCREHRLLVAGVFDASNSGRRENGDDHFRDAKATVRRSGAK